MMNIVHVLMKIVRSWLQEEAFRSRIDCMMTQKFRDEYLAKPRNQEERRLLRHGCKVYSQSEEDGIIEEILRRIGTANRAFLEIGVGNGLENNTVWLLLQGWHGTWVEGSADSATNIRTKFSAFLKSGQLTLIHEFVTLDSIKRMDAEGRFDGLDVLSLDIDGNDYHVLSAISQLAPRVIIVEYNAKFPPPHRFVIEYNERHKWRGSDYFGASLESWNDLLTSRGYSLVGCNITGANAFFVRNDLLSDHFQSPFTPDNHYEPARYWLAPGFVSGHPSDIGEIHRS